MCMWQTGMTYMMPQWYFYVGPNYWQFLLSSSNFSVLGLGLYQLILQVKKTDVSTLYFATHVCVYCVHCVFSFRVPSLPVSLSAISL